MSKLLLVICVLTLSSCASYYVRKDCDHIDWYQYGKDVAAAGHRLSGDSKVHSCEQAGGTIDDVALDHGFKEGMSNYCQPDTVFQTGKKGDFFSQEMCDGDQPRLLQSKHQEGVRIFCEKANGFAAGATGKKYNGICPKDFEAAFVPEFNRGRKNFLSASIASNESAVGEIEMQIGRLESQKFMWNSQLMSLPPEAAQSAVIVTDPYTGQSYAQAGGPDTATQARRNDLELQIQTVDSEIYRQRLQADSLRATTRLLQVEMAAL